MEEPEDIARKKAEYPTGYWFYTTICGALILAFLYAGTQYAKAYFSFTYLEKNGVQTTGVVIERQQTAAGKGNANFNYHILYEFENIFAQQDCKVDIKTRLTPKDKVCRRTVSKQFISETEYKSLSAPTDVKVTYLSDDKGTQSEVMDLGESKFRYVFRIGLSLLLATLTLKTWQAWVKAARKDAKL